MRMLLLPFFVVRLMLSLTPFIAQLLLLILQPSLGLIVISSIAVVYSIVLVNSLWVRYQQQQTALSPTPATSTQFELIQEKIKTNFGHRGYQVGTPAFTEAATRIDQAWHTTPTHRDLAINKALLTAQTGDDATAQKHLEQARYSDPQFSLFTLK